MGRFVLSVADTMLVDSVHVPDGDVEEQSVLGFEMFHVAAVSSLVIKYPDSVARCLADVGGIIGLMQGDAFSGEVTGITGMGNAQGIFKVIVPNEEFLDGESDLADSIRIDEYRHEGVAAATVSVLSGILQWQWITLFVADQCRLVHDVRRPVCPVHLAAYEAGIPVCQCHLDQFFQGCRGRDGVVIHQPDIVAACQYGCFQSQGKAAGTAYVLLRPYDVVFAAWQILQEGFCAVRGAIVYDDDFMECVCLALQCGQAFFQQAEPVVGYDYAVYGHGYSFVSSFRVCVQRYCFFYILQ